MESIIKAYHSSPSNIAFVKYWGKLPGQIPMNPSLSMTLKNCQTKMHVTCNFDSKNIIEIFLDDKPQPSFNPKVERFLKTVHDKFSFLEGKPSLKIESTNTFPHSSGIASSASAFSALTKCLDDLEFEFSGKRKSENELSSIARLGSGSACRSISNGFYHWGKTNREFATKLEAYDPIFNTLCDSILIVNSSRKSTSSSLGHELMNEHPFRKARIEQAQSNLLQTVEAMRSGDVKKWGELLENEALTLHSLMFTSKPSIILLEPNSLAIINTIREYRDQENIDLYFTIDAGANIHLLYFEKDREVIAEFIQKDLIAFCEDSKVIHDKVIF